jgi:hypothetical protein
MNYYIDTEFIEFFAQPRLLGLPVGRPLHTVQLISLGMVCKDGRELYMICKEFDLNSAWQNTWVRENVLRKIHQELVDQQGPYARQHHYSRFRYFSKKSLAWLLKYNGKTRQEIRQEIFNFVRVNPTFYGYYADYDWVVFCSLFGTMVDLPEDFPKICQDLKQTMIQLGLTQDWKNANCPDPVNEHHALADARWNAQLHQALTNALPA